MTSIRRIDTTATASSSSSSTRSVSLAASWRSFVANAHPETVSSWAKGAHKDLLQRFSPFVDVHAENGSTSVGASLGAGPLVSSPGERGSKQK